MSPLRAAARLWTRDSSILLGGFLVTIFLIVYIWWPLAEEYLAYVDWNGDWWRYIDWLLLGIFGFMSITIISRANLKTDLLIIFVGICGGLAIESWGTQTNLWHYYTAERPPLWIIPAWPIASLSIDRITRGLNFLTTKVILRLGSGQAPEHEGERIFKILYWLTFRFLSGSDAGLCCPDVRQVLYLAGAGIVHSAHPYADRLSLGIADLSLPVQGLDIILNCGAPRASAGRITPTKRRRCSRCWRMGWRQSLSGGQGLY